jgi:hypothetical protein
MVTRKRSPKYPSVGLREAVDLIQKLWGKEKRTSVPPEVIATAWGYKGISGPVRSKIGSVRQYGLLEKDSNGLHLSDLAMDIVAHPQNSKEHLDALQKAALNPELFSRVYSSHKEASDEALRAYLIKHEGFNERAMRNFILAYRDAFSLAKLDLESHTEEQDHHDFDVGDYVEWESQGTLQFESRRVTGFSEDGEYAFVEGTSSGIPTEQLSKVDPPAGRDKGSHSVKRFEPKHGMNNDVFSLDEGQVTLEWPSRLSPESYEDLKAWLDLIAKKAKRAIDKENHGDYAEPSRQD